MALSVKVDLEGYPKGIPLGIQGVGVVENGGDAFEIPVGMESVFYSMNGDTIENVLKDQEGMEVTGSAEFTPEPEPTPEPTQSAPAPSQESGLPPGTSAPTEGGGE